MLSYFPVRIIIIASSLRGYLAKEDSHMFPVMTKG